MATKCITITLDAYERLASKKEKNESFSEVIKRIIPQHSLLELAGILSDKEAKELKAHIQELRKDMDERVERTAKQLQ